jgi:DNA-binding CsgD family transcriptional regulator
MTNRKGPRHLPKQVGKSRKSRSHRLTRRQREFLARILEHPWMSSARAAREAGYSESVARKASRIILGSPRVWPVYDRARAAMAEIDENL